MPVLYADLSKEKTIVSNYKAVISDSVNHCFIGWIIVISGFWHLYG